MTRRYVNELAHGDSVEELYLVADKQVRSNRQGNLYLQLDLRDKTGAINARLWNVTDELANSFESGDYLQAKGKVQLFQGALQIILSQIRPVSSASVDADEFLPRSSRNIAALLSQLREGLLSIGDPNLRALAECFLMDEPLLANFAKAPAGVRAHHAYQGGLLEHVVTMLLIARRIADLYPDLNRDLLLIGVFLHDIGKIRELSYEKGFSYTDEGQLIGHLVMGVEILAEKVRQVETLIGEPFPGELLLRIKHMILSHHGELQYGSPKEPMTLEAVALYYLDNLDSKINAFAREIREDPHRDSRWTQFNANMNRRLFKGGADEPSSENDEL